MNQQNRIVSGIGGYLVDVWNLAHGVPINLHSYMKFLALRSLGRRTSAKCLIETGTYLGVTSARCSRAFDHVLTVELDPALANRAAAYLKAFANVKVFQGDAVVLLPQLMARDEAQSSVIFLDGHFSGGETGHGEVPEPALIELRILARYRDRICGIVVDDFRLFGAEPGFPRKSELISTVEELFPPPHFTHAVHADQLIVERVRHGAG